MEKVIATYIITFQFKSILHHTFSLPLNRFTFYTIKTLNNVPFRIPCNKGQTLLYSSTNLETLESSFVTPFRIISTASCFQQQYQIGSLQHFWPAITSLCRIFNFLLPLLLLSTLPLSFSYFSNTWMFLSNSVN